MISSKITIDLYPAEGRQWAVVAIDGSDDPHLTMAAAIKALAAEIARVYIQGASEGTPLDLGSLETLTAPQQPVTVSGLLDTSEMLSDLVVEQDYDPNYAPEASADIRETQYNLAKNWKPHNQIHF